MQKRIALLLAVMLMAALFAACTNTDKPAATPTPSAEATPAPEATSDDTVTITDMTGREITLDEPAERIVALSAADCEILYALGAGDLIVGRGEYCDYPAEVLDKPSVDTGSQMNVEQVLALNPQIILMTAMAQTIEQVEALEATGAKVVVIYAQDIAGVYEAIGIIGQLVGKAGEAADLIADMRQAFAEIEHMSSGDGSKTIYFEVSPLEYGLWTTGSGTFLDELAAMLGLTNAFSDVTGWGEVSQEQVIERDPDYIVTVAMYWGEGPLPVDEILGRSGWENMKAVVNGTVFKADSDETARPGPRLVDAAYSLYDFVYGAE